MFTRPIGVCPRRKAWVGVVKCRACGIDTDRATCPSCGVPLRADGDWSDQDQTRSGHDQTASDQDQTRSGHDQTASDQDQTGSDHDQTLSERDQRSADEDQEAANDDFAAGGDPRVHRQGSAARKRATRARRIVSGLCEETATARIATATHRDREAAIRDQVAEARDARAHSQDLKDDGQARPDDWLLRARSNRARAAADRLSAAADRALAAADRATAAEERATAAADLDKAVLALTLASTDELTGVWARQFGLAEIARELERARRTGNTLVLAFIDVDGLKAVNDHQGHLAGDELLRTVGQALRTAVRPYDRIVRYGGDEFLLAMSNVSAADGRSRVKKVAAAVTAKTEGQSISFGLAASAPADDLQALVARADADLLAIRASGGANDLL